MTEEDQQMLKVGMEAAFKPFANLIERLFGEAADQIGGGWGERLAVRRQIRRIGLFKKLKAAIDEAGFDPRSIPDNVWIPALQAASLEDDETMQQKWANLLANAADPDQDNTVELPFVAVLAELTPDAALFLDDLCDWLESVETNHRIKDLTDHRMGLNHLWHFYTQERSQEDAAKFGILLDLMMRNRLMENTEKAVPIDIAKLFSGAPSSVPRSLQIKTELTYSITTFGAAFLKACRPPKRKQ